MQKRALLVFYIVLNALISQQKNPPLVAGEEGFIIISILNSGQSQNKLITVIR